MLFRSNRQSTNITSKLLNDSITEVIVVQIKDILHHLAYISMPVAQTHIWRNAYVVTIWILYQSKSIIHNLVHKLNVLVGSMVNASLENATAMTMGGNLNTVGHNSIINKLSSRKSLPRHRHNWHLNI